MVPWEEDVKVMGYKGIERMKKRALGGGSWGGRRRARGLMNLRIVLMKF